MSPTMLSPNERSKLFAETLFNKIRMETEQDNSDENVLTRVRTESGQDHTQDETETSDSEGSHDSDSDDRAVESDACNMSLKRSADEMSEGMLLFRFIRFLCTVKPAYAVTSIKQLPVLIGHLFLVLSPVIETFI
jgi:hypothetical protein